MNPDQSGRTCYRTASRPGATTDPGARRRQRAVETGLGACTTTPSLRCGKDHPGDQPDCTA